MSAPAGRAAHDLLFARDNPIRAVTQIWVEGSAQAHSWDLLTGRVVTATRGRIARPTITPDGQWIWWFDEDRALWRRSPFGASARGHAEHPLRLRPAQGVEVALGGEGTAVATRPSPAGGYDVVLLQVGRMRSAGEPTLLASLDEQPRVIRSRDDTLIAIRTPSTLRVLSAYSGALIGSDTQPPEWDVVSFTAAGSVLLTFTSPNPYDPIQAWVWDPVTTLRNELALDLPGHPTRVIASYDGASVFVESFEGVSGNTHVYAGSLSGGAFTRIGPAVGSIVPGSAVAGPDASVYASWWSAEHPARLVNLTKSESQPLSEVEPEALSRRLHQRYAPAVGGYAL